MNILRSRTGRKALDLILFIAILLGGFLAWTSGRERSLLKKEHSRLARSVGDLAIDDPSKLQVVALDTGEPFHFAWRIYFPPKYQFSLWNGDSECFNSKSVESNDSILRVNFRENELGNMKVFISGFYGSMRHGVGDKALADFMRGRWTELKASQLGVNSIAIVNPDEQVSLLSLTLPTRLQEEAKQKLPSSSQKIWIPIPYELKLGKKAK
ncbi:hypothetical protein [Singulisphaera sp. PoT]|uniref:hypothetical protein n=1 Tax=Singulisphaera sp. PoT TaxID=3411797 RepID=UPI003BF5E2FE